MIILLIIQKKINQKYGSRSENRFCEDGITSNRRL